jgi:hypothetical protein
MLVPLGETIDYAPIPGRAPGRGVLLLSAPRRIPSIAASSRPLSGDQFQFFRAPHPGAKPTSPSNRRRAMPKPNYAFAKRQRELAKKQKKEAKQRERVADKIPAADPTPSDAPTATQTETPGG